jgi:hypothetical protein
VAERPILFSGPMVRAILEGRKTQTRRVVKPQPVDGVQLCFDAHARCWFGWVEEGERVVAPTVRCPYGAPGDTLWVRETWAPSRFKAGDPYYAYRADGEYEGVGRWRPSIHMPRFVSRLSLLVKSVSRSPGRTATERHRRAAAASLANALTRTLLPTGRA